MSKEFNTAKGFEKAQKRVKELKGFYNHLKIFVFVHLLLLLFKSGLMNSFMPEGFAVEYYYFDWIYWNFAIWGFALALQAIYVFVPSPFKKWEEKQIQKYIEEDNEETEKYL